VQVLRNMVRPSRFELLTFCFGGKRSIQLSYGRTFLHSIAKGPPGAFMLRSRLLSGRVASRGEVAEWSKAAVC
jgi:hypothetical protein